MTTHPYGIDERDHGNNHSSSWALQVAAFARLVGDEEQLAYVRDLFRKPDVMYHDAWPIRHPTLLFGGLALDEPAYIALWNTLDPDPAEDEVIRNYPIRQPLLWVGPHD